jgi:malonate-semialdehyde dehydrogenase (acetylating) / methylmalonate-semialdehyde dehydrogenase
MIRNFIGGEWASSQASAKLEVINPANGEVLDHCPVGCSDDVNQAVTAAKNAFLLWRQTPATERVQYFFKLKNLMEESSESLALSITKENGKTLVEARGSVRRAIQMVETACGIPSLMMGESFEDIAGGIDCVAMRRPMGVFAAVTPFNFPAMVSFWFWPFAVASGNTFVLKPSERVPITQMKIFELIEKAGFPKGVINMVHGAKDVVNALCDHPDVQGVSFVGSTPVAKHVYTRASQSGKRVQALGGAKNFMVVLPDAVMDKAVNIALESITGCAGERCLAGSVIVCVGKETYEEVTERMLRLTREVMVGDGTKSTTMMGPLISQAAKDRVKDLIQSGVQEGAKLLVDGRQGVDQMPGYFLKPSLLTEVKKHMRVAREEIFGPVVCLAQVESMDEAIEWINSCNYANTTTLFTTNGAAARKFSYEVDPSMIGINIGVPAPMSFFSFGGAKDSFYGDIKAHGSAGVEFYTDKKVTVQKWLKDSSIW